MIGCITSHDRKRHHESLVGAGHEHWRGNSCLIAVIRTVVDLRTGSWKTFTSWLMKGCHRLLFLCSFRTSIFLKNVLKYFHLANFGKVSIFCIGKVISVRIKISRLWQPCWWQCTGSKNNLGKFGRNLLVMPYQLSSLVTSENYFVFLEHVPVQALRVA